MRPNALRAPILALMLAMLGAVLIAGSSALAGTVTGTITPGGSPLTVTISTAGDNAAITFSGTAGQRVSLSLTGVTLNWATDSIKNPNGTTLTSKAIFPSNGFIDVQTLPTTGTYTISIQPNSNATGSQTLKLYLVPTNPSGTITPGGAPATSTTTTPGQNASRTFSGTAGQRVSLNITSVSLSSPTCCPIETVSIVKPGGTTLTSLGGIGSFGGWIDTQTLPTTGTYTVLVDPQSDAYGSTTLTLFNVLPDVSGPITPSGSGGQATPATTTPGQNVGLTFTGTQGQRVSLKISGVALSDPTLYEVISIKKADGTILAGSGAVTSTGWIDTQTLPTNGTYTVSVDPYKNATSTTTLALYDVPADYSGSLAVDGDAAIETTTVPGQDARLTFAGTAGQAVYVPRGGVTTANSIIKILNPDGTLLSSSGIVGAYDGTQTTTLPSTGTYTVFVDGWQDATGKMTLAVSGEDDTVGDLSLDQAANTESDPDPTPASPTPVSPSGPVQPGSYGTETWDGVEVGNETGLNVITTSASGTFALSGLIKTDNTQLPVAGATVTIVQGGTAVASTTTDSDGAFAFVDLPALTYGVTVVPPSPFLTAEHLNNPASADEAYEQTIEVSSTTSFVVDHSSDGISYNTAAPTAPGTAFSRTRIPPLIRVQLLDIYPPNSFVNGQPVNCNAKPNQPQNPPVRTYDFRYYILRVGMEETGTIIDYNETGAKALFALIQNFAWLHATLPGTFDVTNASNQYSGQCFRDGTNVKRGWRTWINDVLDERVVGPDGKLLETQYRAGTRVCNDQVGSNIASQQGIDALTEDNCPKKENWHNVVTYYFSQGTAVVQGLKPLPPTATAFAAPWLGGLRFNAVSKVSGLPVGWRYEISKVLGPNSFRHLAFVRQTSRTAAAAWTYPGSSATGCFQYRARAENPVGWSAWATVNGGALVCYP